MKRRYITFYQLYMRPIPHFKTYGMPSTDKWLSCMGFGLRMMLKGNVTFFTFTTPSDKHHLTYRK